MSSVDIETGSYKSKIIIISSHHHTHGIHAWSAIDNRGEQSDHRVKQEKNRDFLNGTIDFFLFFSSFNLMAYSRGHANPGSRFVFLPSSFPRDDLS